MKCKTICSFLLLCIAFFTLCGCGNGQNSLEQSTGAVQDQPILSPTAATDDVRQEVQISAPMVSAEAPVVSQNLYLDFMKNLNPSIADMDELFYQEKDMDNDGNMEIIAAFGNKAKNEYGTDLIEASFALRDRNGKIDLIKQDFCDGGGYECGNIQFARFTGSDSMFIVVGVTNGMNMNGMAIYEIAGNDIKELCRTVSPAGICNAYLSEQQKGGSYGGFTKELSSYDVLYFPVTVFYKFNNGAFEPQSTAVEVGEYPKTPTDAVIQYLSLNCLFHDYYSLDISERLYELARYAICDIYGAPSGWYSALYQYILGITLPGEPSITAREIVLGETAQVNTVLANPVKNEKATADFNLNFNNEKWHISSADGTINMGTGKEEITFSTYPVQKKYYNDAGGYADLDLQLPKIDGSYAGIPKINEFFAGKEQFFYNQLPFEILQDAGKVEGKNDGYNRLAHYRFEAKISDIISISAYLDGGAGGVGWAGIEGDVFDLGTGKKLGLSDIFNTNKNSYLDCIYDFVSAEIASNIKKAGDRSEYLFNDPYSDDGYESVRGYDENDFYLTNDSLAVFYQKYALAVGAAGPQVFYIPLSSVSDMLTFVLP